MKKEILKQLKSDYEKLEIKPSADLWDRIDQKSEKMPDSVLKPSFQWWKYAAAVLVFISVGTLIYYISYKSKFDYKKTDYMVNQVLKKTVNPVKSDLGNQSVISNEEPVQIQNEKVKIVNENHEKIKPDASFIPKKEKKQEIAGQKEQQVVVNQPENNTIHQAKTEVVNKHELPVLAETQRSKSSYINADELLSGREFEKARIKSEKDNRKFGVIHFDRVTPSVGNVTVLGVTVYLDSK
ncbi:hypothetical protein [Chryseobacterium shigense]|uniref:Uncharacterized protein n=1 Tax=Chryseobacterium shigense TaxID=297244 RepID=A0A841NH83_9FLAO|nr:hypothetical protein [Chryseobacterium shigense]MBB6370195.1 hypothetical protein [Chryseobacterium shigense]